MPNACFRCKTPIDSGSTFCRSCRGKVDPSKLERTGESKVWMGVAAFPVWVVASIVLSGVAGLLLPEAAVTLIAIGTSFVSLVLAFGFLVALLMDAGHLRERDDVDWNPSQVGYWGLAFVAFFLMFVPAPFIAAYHLYKRHKTAGLPR